MACTEDWGSIDLTLESLHPNLGLESGLSALGDGLIFAESLVSPLFI